MIARPVFIDRDGRGQLLLARRSDSESYIVISDQNNDVVCTVPYERDDEGESEARAEALVAAVNGGVQ